MTRVRSRMAWAMLPGLVLLPGCRVRRVVNLGSTSVTVPADWHEYVSGSSSRATALQLERSGIPFFEKDSVAGFYVSSNPVTNTPQGAQVWQERMLQPPKRATVPATSARQYRPPPFMAGRKEQINGTFVTLCVTSARADTTEVLNCVVEGAPVMFSFAGSEAGADEARAMLRSLQ